MIELLGYDRSKVSSIIKNYQHELTIKSVIENVSPGNVFVDDALSPRSFLIKTPECNLIGGYAFDEEFNNSIINEIDYYDTILCDTDEWQDIIMKIHRNNALKPYTRKYYKRNVKSKIIVPDTTVQVKYIYAKDLQSIMYKNKDMVLDWINILNLNDLQKVCLAALIILDDQIVSCSCIDCYIDKSAEIGIKTCKGYERKGYGFLAASALVNELNSNGITDIGWHCMATNIGSQKIAKKCGFSAIYEYPLFSPYPPIENTGDVSIAEWYKLGAFYSDMGKISTAQYWQAARCWAKAKEKDKVIGCIQKLVDNDQLWFLNYISECEEFIDFQQIDEWQQVIQKAMEKIA